MSVTTPSSSQRPVGTVAGAVEEQFWALVCADEQLLAAQSEAILTAEWPERPTPPVRLTVRRADHHPAGTPGHRPRAPGARPTRPGLDEWTRQRSPPQTGKPWP